MKKRIFALIIAGAVVLSAVSGCTDTKDDSSNTTPAAVTTPADEGTQAPEEGTQADAADTAADTADAGDETTAA
ncbi:MAG: hypothetical protein HDT44_10245 [Ruminococcaceae bacterium]|nr:hypothetical protein [Oscillospiraceae bacterium]